MDREDQIRKEILFQAYGGRPAYIRASAILRECKRQQMDFTLSEILRELPFLAGEKLIEIVPSPGLTEVHYQITSAGVRHYEQTYAA